MLIVTNPSDVYTNTGSNITFSVSGSGAPLPILYQWYSGSVSSSYVALSDGGSFTGSQTTVLTITNVTSSLVGSYFVTAQNSETAQFTSSVANLYIL